MTTQKINVMGNNAQGKTSDEVKNSSTNQIDFIDAADLDSDDENGVFISDREKLWTVQSSQIIEMMNLKIGDTVYIVLAGDDMEYIHRDESDARDNMDEFNWEQWGTLSEEECREIVENVLGVEYDEDENESYYDELEPTDYWGYTLGEFTVKEMECESGNYLKLA